MSQNKLTRLLSYFGALCTRFFLGFVEAAFFPGALFLISKWYTRKELSRRTALFFCGNLISNAFGSLIASGILDTMDGVLGFTAWRWLFFVEGALTVFVAIIAMFVLPDFPEDPCSWLTPAERALAIHRMAEVAEVDVMAPSTEDSAIFTEDGAEAPRRSDEAEQGLRLALADWKVWWLALSSGVTTVSLSFNAFFPTLSATLGYGLTTTLLLCVPPWIFSALVSVVVSSHSDRVGERFLHIAIPLFIAALGFVISILTMNTMLRYLSLFLMAQAYAASVCFLAWATGTFSRPSSKRAVALALINCGSTVGNIIGSWVSPVQPLPAIAHIDTAIVLHLALIFHHRSVLPLLPVLGFGAVQMNSLAYLSRQFDVLASAKTPPSTPSSDRPSFIGDRLGKERASDPELPRVSTWSTKSFLLSSSSPNTTSTAPKRSFSSPAFASIRKLGLQSSIPPSASPDVEARPWSKFQLERIIRRIFFIRVFVLVWDNLRAAWLSLWKHGRLEEHSISISAADKPLEVGEKPIEDDLVQSPSSVPLISPASLSHTSDSTQHTSIELAVPPPTNIRSSESPLDVSRSSTPSSGMRKTPFNLPKTLVLDLDETLIHSTSRPMHSSGGGGGFFGLGSFRTRNKGASHMVEVVLGGRSTLYHVYKRPFVDFFLRTVSGWYTLVIFTASMQEYADPVIDWLDAGRGILDHRFFRDSCTQLPNGSFTKDLSIVEADLSRVCLVDNSPVSYRVNEANGIPIEGWTHDPSDEALLDLLPVLDSLRFTSDVRRVLGLRTAGGHGHS
ncbi:hypothetical protein C0992_002523 [Termitomyces sp. T32_za158]|nr:hypothetical protein C0992_002523 [Termitomyces sp. T32_za158]